MLSFSTLLLRAYYNEIGWNEDNLYANISRSSSAILDFAVPPTLSLQISKAPTDIFYASYALDALPQLNGGVSYITSSIPLKGISPSRTVPLHNMVDHFRVFPPPKRPSPSEEEYLAGDLVIPARDYLLYSRLHFPTLHLSGLATTKLSPGWQASLMFMHSPATGVRGFGVGAGSGSGISESGSSSANPATQGAGNGASSSSTSPCQSTIVTPPPPPGNVILSLQQDTGRYSTEYTYSATDGMLGFRGLYNFGLTEATLTADEPLLLHDRETPTTTTAAQDLLVDKQTRIDEEEAMEGGLRGRFSAGGEIYFSRKQRSLGVSTGLRFTTIPPLSTHTHTHHPPSPPTTLTLLYNPLMGFLSTAYSAQISPHLALSSRYGVNVYSYESDLCIGGEWWIGSGTGKGGWRGLRGGSDGASSNVEELSSTDVDNTSSIFSLPPTATTTTAGGESKSFMAAMRSHTEPQRNSDRDGVLKAKISGNGLVSFLYESRIRKCLVSVGVVSDFSSRSSNPVKTIGMEVQYFSD